MSELNCAMFNGYGDDTPYFGQGRFVEGTTYRIIDGPDYYPNKNPDAKFIDECGDRRWEDLKYFDIPDDILNLRIAYE